MPAPRLANGLITLRNQASALAPNRSKVSDGWIGDLAHRRRKSDHNPDRNGVVHALDLTHDPFDDLNIPDDDLDMEAFMNALVTAKDPRIDYLIWNRRIYYPKSGWRKYNGSNPHNKHGHISIVDGPKADDAKSWDLSAYGKALPTVGQPPAVPNPYAKRPLLRQGSSQETHVRELQTVLNKLGTNPPLKVDGDFGPSTFNAVIALQKRAGIKADGKVGQYTWEAIDRAKAAPKTQAKDNASIAMERFQQKHGWQKVLAAGFTGRAQQEAYPEIRTGVLGDDDTAFGGWQWRLGRRADYYTFADERNVLRTDWPTQIDFVPHELATSRYEKARAGKMMASADTLEKACAVAMTYCRPRGYKYLDPDKHGWPATISAASKGHGWKNTVKFARALIG